MRKRDIKECADSRALTSADCGSDHQMVWAKVQGTSWQRMCKRRKAVKLETGIFKNEIAAKDFEKTLHNEMIHTNQSWSDFSETIRKVAEEKCPKKARGNKPWITEACLDVINKRRAAKINDFQGERYRELCKEVSKTCRKAKRVWLREKAVDAENAYRKGNTRTTYKLVKEISGKQPSKPGIGVMDKNGTIIYEKEAIKQRWFEYGKQLFSRPDDDDGPNLITGYPTELEPEVLVSEIRKALYKIKSNKAGGLDGITAEVLKAGGETMIQIMKSIIDEIWVTGEWPKDWTVSEMIRLPKVSGTRDCAKHRTISLISHASKIFLEIFKNASQLLCWSSHRRRAI
eukprot:Seg1706.5 transcript_id=Seg1706.5/GoldUCD/mRNA.D3Y31 product="Transposon TX1 putative 149 kDa protein" pseudo=true protein_id=Seg1706.5/GoldUCD/D3Y31